MRYEVVDGADHDARPRRKRAAGDPDRDRVMDGLAQGHAVRIRCAGEQERRMLARSVGRRAAHRPFRVGIRHGPDFLSVRESEDLPRNPPGEGSELTRSGLRGKQEPIHTEASLAE